MRRFFVILTLFALALPSYAENCELGVRQFLTQLQRSQPPSAPKVQAQIEGLQITVDRMSKEDLHILMGQWQSQYLPPSSPGYLPGLSPKHQGILFLNLDYIGMVIVLNHMVSTLILGKLSQYVSDHPQSPLPDPLLYEFKIYLVLLKLFLEEKDPMTHVLSQLAREVYFQHRPTPLAAKTQLENAYVDPFFATEKRRVDLLTQWEDRYLNTPQGYLPGLTPKEAAGRRFRDLDYQAKRKVISNVINGNYGVVEKFLEEHPGQPIPENLLDLFRVETILRMYYKPRFDDPLPSILGTFVPSTLIVQINMAQNSILVQPDDLKQRMIAEWENQQFKEKGYLIGLSTPEANTRFSELPYTDQVNVLRSFASTLQSIILKYPQDHPLDTQLSADIIFRIQVYRLLVAQLNMWVRVQKGALDPLQESLAQLQDGGLRAHLIKIRQEADGLSPLNKQALLSAWEDAEFRQFEHLPGLHHDPKFVGERFKTLSPNDQETVINNLAQRIQTLIDTHQETNPGQAVSSALETQLMAYQLLIEGSRGQPLSSP